ncbi:MAG: hypothetical protein U1E42_11895 [Rhodospirillales bacterium]
MTAKELERLLALRTGFGQAHLDQTTRALRAAAILPASRRGRGARPLDGRDVALVLIALAAAEQPAKAPAAVCTYAGLRRAGDESDATLVDTLTRALAHATEAARIRTVLVCRSWPMVTITRPTAFDIGEERYLPIAGLPASVHDAPVFCGLGGRLLQAVANGMTIEQTVEEVSAVA